jgi:Mor family transcriptional regulator
MTQDILDEIISQVKIEDIPENYQDMAEAVGVINFLQLLKIAGGTTIYLPLPINVIKEARDRAIVREYTGKNLKELAVKFNLSETWIRQIVAKGDSNDK